MDSSKQVLLFLVLLSAPLALSAGTPLPGLNGSVTVVRDTTGTPHIFAQNEHDLFFMQGWIHAEDRLFQMDLLRRSTDGTLAEVLGPLALPNDVQSRTIGLYRSVEASWNAHSEEMRGVLQAYSDGVNAFIAAASGAGQLPPEYSVLELKKVREWTPLDSLLVGKALGAATSLSVTDDIDLTIALTLYQNVGAALGFDGTKLFSDDLFRIAPFGPAATIPDAEDLFTGAKAKKPSKTKSKTYSGAPDIDKKALKQARGYLKRIRELPKIPGVPSHEGGDMGGSNTWVVSGKHAPDGNPMLANDMHLQLNSPTIFHEIHLAAPGFNVTGSSLAGAPCVVRGHNQHVAWGFTNARIDSTDIYAEVIVPNGDSPIGLGALRSDGSEPIIAIPVQFKVNQLESLAGQPPVFDNVVPFPAIPDDDVPEVVLIVRGRNNGPIISLDTDSGGHGSALSVQSVGFGPTQDPEGICALNRAANLADFKSGLQLLDFGSQNISYADTAGNIAYFLSGELPLREDIESPSSLTRPPYFIRNGTGGHDWIPESPQPNQATPFKILPFKEMPQIENPESGIIVNANNDQNGNTLDNNSLNLPRANGGLLYINWGGLNFSIRAGRITEMINERLARGSGQISFGQMKRMQADIVLDDARVFVPYILEAFDNGTRDGVHDLLQALAADPGVAEAVQRLRAWDFTTPTGITEGYDANPEEADIDASVATTIYSTWRGMLAANTIDAFLDQIGALIQDQLDALGLSEMPRPNTREEVVKAMKHLLENDGQGESGLDFFRVDGVADAATRRDIVVLAALRDALDLLASDAFAPAFGYSTVQDDYRWGLLHRIVFRHPLGEVAEVFNVPPAFNRFPAPLESSELEGIPVDGAFETVDTGPPLGSTNIRVNDSNSFMFDFAPTGRFVARLKPGQVRAETSLPGGESAIPSSPFYVNLLEPWLFNETHRMLVTAEDVLENAVVIRDFMPAGP